MPGLSEKNLKELQEIFRLTPVTIIGSGHSCSFGFPSMGDLGLYLQREIPQLELSLEEQELWNRIKSDISDNLEASLNKISQADASAEKIIVKIRQSVTKLFRSKSKDIERAILCEPFSLDKYPLLRLLQYLYNGAPQHTMAVDVITTNYDYLIEILCDLAKLPITTGFIGYRIKHFDSTYLTRPIYRMRLITAKGKYKAAYDPVRFIRILKPHGSINWYIDGGKPIENSLNHDIDEAAIVVPGPFKYRETTVCSLFDEIRAIMNDILKDARAVFTYGFGFNDDHLQRVIEDKLAKGMPLVILSKDWTAKIKDIISNYPHVYAFRECEKGTEYWCNGQRGRVDYPLWELNCFMKTVIE